MMFTKPSMAVASLVAVSQAFLLPPTVSSSDSDTVEILPFYKSVGGSEIIEIECKECPVLIGTEPERLWMLGTPSKFDLKFDVLHKIGEPDLLMLNDVQIFPYDPELSSAPMMVTQTTVVEDSFTDGYFRPRAVKLGYELMIERVKEPSEEDQLSLFDVRMQVVELDDKWVNGLDAVHLDLIITPTDDFLITNARTTETTNPTVGSGKTCTSMFCRFRQALSDKLSGFKLAKGKGCNKGKGTKGMGRPHGGPKKYGNQGPKGHSRHALGKAFRFLRAIVIHLVLPFCIGIAAGMTAIFIGTLVGSSIVFLWRTLFRQGKRGPYERVEQEEFSVEQDEKDPSMLKEEVAPPLYQESNVLAVVDEKSADN